MILRLSRDAFDHELSPKTDSVLTIILVTKPAAEIECSLVGDVNKITLMADLKGVLQ